IESSHTELLQASSARCIDQCAVGSDRDVEAAIAVGQDFFEVRPMERLTAFEEDVQKFLCHELIDKGFPLLGRELRPFARSAIRIAKLAVHTASLIDTDRQFERFFQL